MAKVVPAAVDLHNSDNNVAAVVAMAHVAHAATALQSDKDKDKATVADLQKVRGAGRAKYVRNLKFMVMSSA